MFTNLDELKKNQNNREALYYNLTRLEIAGQNKIEEITDLGLKFYWNLNLANRFNCSKLSYSNEEIEHLLKNAFYENYEVPNFLVILNRLYEENFLQGYLGIQQYKKYEFEYFLIDYIQQIYSSEFSTYPLSKRVLTWFNQTTKERYSQYINFTKIMISSYLGNQEYKSRFNLATYEGSFGWLGFFNTWIAPKINGYCHTETFQFFLNSPADDIIFSKEIGLSNYIKALWFSHNDFQQWLDIYNKEQAKIFIQWFFEYKVIELTNYEQPDWLDLIYPYVAGSIKKQDTKTSIEDNYQDTHILTNFELSPRPFGLNIIGWPRTEIGIGEDARVGFDALRLISTQSILIDAENRVITRTIEKNKSYDKYIQKEVLYNTDIVYLDAATQFRYYSYDFLAKNPLSNRKIILVSPWELPSWPKELQFVFDHVDMFWAATRYIYDAFAPFFKDKIIQLAPPAVVVSAEEIDDFDVANVEGTFVFLTTFDGLSSIHRKNPFAVVSAFLQAFPKNQHDDVRLVVKTMNFSPENPELKKLASQIASDNRIEIVNATLSKVKLNVLIRKTHCFVSLHRAEGFGRNIAEMMLFNRPVIVSRFSGNLDFCFEENSYLVDGSLIPVMSNYAYSKNQYWFDASVDHAAQCMKQVYQNRGEASKRAKKAKEYMSHFHSIEETGKRYKKLLDEV